MYSKKRKYPYYLDGQPLAISAIWFLHVASRRQTYLTFNFSLRLCFGDLFCPERCYHSSNVLWESSIRLGCPEMTSICYGELASAVLDARGEISCGYLIIHEIFERAQSLNSCRSSDSCFELSAALVLSFLLITFCSYLILDNLNFKIL